MFSIEDAYNEYYDFIGDICDIGVESFAARAQTMLVDYRARALRRWNCQLVSDFLESGAWTNVSCRDLPMLVCWMQQQHGNRSVMTRHQEGPTAELSIGAVPQLALPLSQDLSWRGAHATPPEGWLLEFIHLQSHPD